MVYYSPTGSLLFRKRDHPTAHSIRALIKLEFHYADTDTNTDILARILADTFDTRDFLKLFLWQAERHTDIPFPSPLATIFPSRGCRRGYRCRCPCRRCRRRGMPAIACLRAGVFFVSRVTVVGCSVHGMLLTAMSLHLMFINSVAVTSS